MAQTTEAANRNAKVRPSNFPPVRELPNSEPQVILAFHGLMSMSFQSFGGNCEVGIHDAAANHHLKIKVFDVASGSAQPFYEFDVGPVHPSPLNLIHFDVFHADPDKHGFYEPINFSFAAGTQPRIVGDPLDFRQVNDFEGPEFYDVNDELPKHPAKIRPLIMVPTGIFVTLVPTIDKFRRDAAGDSLKLGPVAEIVGAGIYLQPNGSVGLRFGPNEIKLPLKSPGKTLYVFLFDNSCPQSVCNFDPDSRDPKKRNDFFEYYQMFDIPTGKNEFELILDERVTSPSTPVPGPGRDNYLTVAKFLSDNPFKESTNEAPCGPVAFGGGG